MKRENRTVTVNSETESAYYQLLTDGRAFIGFITGFVMGTGFQLKHKAGCTGGFFLTRHSHYIRVRLNGVPVWRIQCKKCGAVFTVLPRFVLRYRKTGPETAEKALLSPYSGQSPEITSVILSISAMAVYRLICSIGRIRMVTLLTRCGLSLPEFFGADEKHSGCLTGKAYLPAVVRGHPVRHTGYTEDRSAAAFEKSYGQFRQSGLKHDPSWKVRGILTDSSESTAGTMKKLFPDARIGNRLLHAAGKAGQKLKNVPADIREDLGREFFRMFRQARERTGLKVFSFGRKPRRFREKVLQTAGTPNARRTAERISRKKAGRFSVPSCPDMPVTTVRADQAHNAADRKLFMMGGASI